MTYGRNMQALLSDKVHQQCLTLVTKYVMFDGMV